MKTNISSIEEDLLISALTTDSSTSPTEHIIPWLNERRNSVTVNIEQVDISQLKSWPLNPRTGNIGHDSGKFFCIEGIRVETNWGNACRWEQPIINQPEVGFLGFLGKKFDGVLHLLVQAKIEPGNINSVQLSPTLQATKSNYTRVHKGAKPRFIEYFNGEIPCRVLVDQLQSEQGARFLRKRNRNIIVETHEFPEALSHPDFKWMTIGQIKRLANINNTINMDTRTVIAGINYGSCGPDAISDLGVSRGIKGKYLDFLLSATHDGCELCSFREIMSWLAGLKSTFDLSVERIPLSSVREWDFEEGVIRRPDRKYFSVIGVDVFIQNREVSSWQQPMIQPSQEGLIAFIVKRINGVIHFLVQAKLEAGNLDIIELAPTVQCLTGNYRSGKNEYTVPFIAEVLSARPENIIFDTYQSEEGGRFFQEQNRSMIVEVSDSNAIEAHPHYCWMTLQQMLTLVEYNNFLNIAARSLIASVQFA